MSGNIRRSDLHPEFNDELNSVTSQLADIITVDVNKYIDINATDDSQAFQQAINDIVANGGGKIIVPRLSREYNIEQSVVCSATGDVNLCIEGIGNPIINTKSNIIMFDFKSSVYPSTGYPSRIQWVGIKNLKLKGNNGYSGIGINIKSFAFLYLKDVQVSGFNKGYNLEDGSEAILENIRGMGSNYGLIAKRSADASADIASIVFIECNFHNNNIASMQLDGIRQITCFGGSIIASNASVGAVELRTTQNSIDYVSFNGCNFENADSNSQIVIGNSADTGSVSLVNIDSCQLAMTPDNKIVVNNCKVLNIKNCSVDTNHSPTVLINNTVGSDFRLNIEGCYPYWADYNVKDLRDTTKKTNSFFLNYPIINKFNRDFTKSNIGYGSNKSFTLDVANFVTGTQSILFTQDGTEKYLSYYFKDIDGQYTYLYEGSEIIIDYIAKFGSTISPIIYGAFANIDGSGVAITNVSQCLLVQSFSNGFERRITKIKVPTGKRLEGIRITNTALKTTDLYIDYLEIRSKELPVQNYAFSATAPTAGTWIVNEKVINPTPTAGGYEKQVCITAGTPGVFKGAGLIQS